MISIYFYVIYISISVSKCDILNELKGCGNMPASKAQQKAVAKYENKNYDKHLLRMPKGKKAALQAHATERNESLNRFVNRAIDGQLERDTGVYQPDTSPVSQSDNNDEQKNIRCRVIRQA